MICTYPHFVWFGLETIAKITTVSRYLQLTNAPTSARRRVCRSLTRSNRLLLDNDTIAPLMPFPKGARFGPFAVLSLLSEGGRGEVYHLLEKRRINAAGCRNEARTARRFSGDLSSGTVARPVLKWKSLNARERFDIVSHQRISPRQDH